MTENGLTDLCKKNIQNAFDNVHLSDKVYGLLGIMPGEMLHISGVGLLKYMFASLECLISLTRSKKLHHCIVMDGQKQSKSDFPRMLVQNGIRDGTKM